MTRTNIDIDDELIAEAMTRFDLSTKREAVDFALRRLVGVQLTPEALLELRGSGWGGDVDAIRDDNDPWREQ